MIARVQPIDWEEYRVSTQNGFLPDNFPVVELPDVYYAPWEAIMERLPALIQSRRLRDEVDALPVLSTSHLKSEREWRRAYSVLTFIVHAYLWGGDQPAQVLPAAISIPVLEVSLRLELPPTATYASLNLWNWAPHSPETALSIPENVRIINTFTGTRDEEWFFLISVAMEARCAPIIPTMLKAIDAVTKNDCAIVTDCLITFADCALDLGNLLERMYEQCDPYVFYNHIRPFLAGTKNMSVAGLPNGLFYDEGEGKGAWRQYSGGSNAQSSLIQFLDAVLGVEHAATGELKAGKGKGFLQEMRDYMPGPHRRFLEHVSSTSNIREYVTRQEPESDVSNTFNAAVAMLAGFRDKHIQLVTRYIIMPSRNPKTIMDTTLQRERINLATASEKVKPGMPGPGLYGTGGTQLIPFLKQTRDETKDAAVFMD